MNKMESPPASPEPPAFSGRHQRPRPPAAARFTPPRSRSPLVKLGWWGIAGYLAYATYVALHGNPSGALAGSIVVFFSLLPAILWAARGAGDFPIFPLYAFTFSYTFGLQMMNNRQIVAITPPDLFWTTCLAIGGFLVIATLTWLAVTRKPVTPPRVVMVVGGTRAEPVLLGCLVLATAFHVSGAAGWLGWLGAFGTIVRAFMFCLGTLSIFILSYEIGKGRVSRGRRILFFSLLTVSMIALSTGLLLVQAMGTGLLALASFIFASHRVPWKTVIGFILLISILHYGKYSMREKYWGDDGIGGPSFQPWQYPALMTEWFGAGLNYYLQPGEAREQEHTNLLERSGLLHLFLFVQDQTERRPLMMGQTYSVLPSLLMPRILAPDRAGAHESTTLLNIYFGLQSREDTQNTTIGWGLFNEAYANFGYAGLAGLAVILGGFFGWIARLSKGCPVNSYQGLLAVVVMNTAYQSEYSSGVFVTVLFQSVVALTVLRFIIMRPVRLESPAPFGGS